MTSGYGTALGVLPGVFIGKGDAAEVVIGTQDGEITGTVVTLADKPGWGAWYATSPAKPPQIQDQVAGRRIDRFVRSVTVYAAAGTIVAQTVAPTGKVTAQTVQLSSH
ncbi:hypothetical protein [Streptomyces sp. NBC_01643]|uniref:hypothetical protein n=1 Tax=Streptomyces sp. NBC_01643 TaxID=2975906 RepID=UPI00386BA683|nr:hypothetical protein OHB03_46815 [Streptomyces sp. NBC_01643]